jgi:hypothetical protein
MATTTKLRVRAVDNELYLLASTPHFSSEICHLKAGRKNPVDYTVVPQGILSAGEYTLTMIGINWGGPQTFEVIVTTGGVDTAYNAPTTGPVGAAWTVSIPITV